MIKTTEMDNICSRPEQCPFPVSGRSGPTWEAIPTADRTMAGENIRHPARQDAVRKVEKAVAHMMAHLDKPMRVSVLSSLVGVSTSGFYQLFKLATGATPNDFFIRARMRRAGQLFRQADLSVKEVAARLGYDDPFYFSRVFKSVHRVSPSHYRAAAYDYPEGESQESFVSIQPGSPRNFPPLTANQP